MKQLKKEREDHYNDLNESEIYEIYERMTNTKGIPVYTFNDLTDWGVTLFLSFIIISGTTNGERVAYAFNGSRLWQIFKDELKDTNYDFSIPFEFESNLHTKGAQWDGKYWFPGIYGSVSGVQYQPIASFNNRMYGQAVSGSLHIDYLDTTKYQISGNVESSNFGHNMGAIDKLVNSVTVNCKPLATGETLEMFRSTDEGSNFTSIGTLSFASDGAISDKTLYFPSGFVTKTWEYKAQLVGPGTSTPTLKDVAFQHRPLPDLKKRWTLSINANDRFKLLNGQEEDRDAKALMSELWLEKEAKRTITFEDVDAFSANIVSAFTSAATSARVSNTRLMPPKGRIRVMSAGVAEEMTYTSAEGGAIKGISRGQKSTKARDYTSAHALDNNYTVLVADISESLNTTDEQETESIAKVSLLEV